jgi:hypothetical protein
MNEEALTTEETKKRIVNSIDLSQIELPHNEDIDLHLLGSISDVRLVMQKIEETGTVNPHLTNKIKISVNSNQNDDNSDFTQSQSNTESIANTREFQQNETPDSVAQALDDLEPDIATFGNPVSDSPVINEGDKFTDASQNSVFSYPETSKRTESLDLQISTKTSKITDSDDDNHATGTTENRNPYGVTESLDQKILAKTSKITDSDDNHATGTTENRNPYGVTESLDRKILARASKIIDSEGDSQTIEVSEMIRTPEDLAILEAIKNLRQVLLAEGDKELDNLIDSENASERINEDIQKTSNYIKEYFSEIYNIILPILNLLSEENISNHSNYNNQNTIIYHGQKEDKYKPSKKLGEMFILSLSGYLEVMYRDSQVMPLMPLFILGDVNISASKQTKIEIGQHGGIIKGNIEISNCKNLTSVSFSENVTLMKDIKITNCSNLNPCNITVPLNYLGTVYFAYKNEAATIYNCLDGKLHTIAN